MNWSSIKAELCAEVTATVGHVACATVASWMGRLIRHQCERNLQYNVLTAGAADEPPDLNQHYSTTTTTHTHSHTYVWVSVYSMHKRSSSSNILPLVLLPFQCFLCLQFRILPLLLLLPFPHAILRAHKQCTPCTPLTLPPAPLPATAPPASSSPTMQHAHFVWLNFTFCIAKLIWSAVQPAFALGSVLGDWSGHHFNYNGHFQPDSCRAWLLLHSHQQLHWPQVRWAWLG